MKKKSNQKAKTKFRSSKEWKDFRHDLKKRQKIDPLSLNRLTTRANCHHRDLDPLHYEDLSDPSHFVMYNKATHDCIHYLYNISKRRGLLDLLDSLHDELYTMLVVNGEIEDE